MAGAERRFFAVAPRVLAVLAAVVMAIALLPLAGGAQQGSVEPQQLVICDSPPPSPFADRPQVAPVHVESVDCLWEVEVTRGTIGDDGQLYYLPKNNVTRGQFAAFLFRAIQVLGLEAQLPAPLDPPFPDVPAGHVFYEEVNRLAAAGVILGLSDGSFGTNNPIRRDQTASLLLRAYETLFAPYDAQGGPYFSDTIGNVHEGNIDAAFELGLIAGKVLPTATELGVYAPAELTSREQMATVLTRFLRRLAEDEPGPSPSPTATAGGQTPTPIPTPTATPTATPTPTPTPTPTATPTATPSPTPSPDPSDPATLVQTLTLSSSHLNPVKRNTQVTITATVRDADEQPVAQARMRFEVYRANSNSGGSVLSNWTLAQTAARTSGATGIAQFAYTSGTAWSIDRVVACVVYEDETPAGQFCATASGTTLDVRDDRPASQITVHWQP